MVRIAVRLEQRPAAPPKLLIAQWAMRIEVGQSLSATSHSLRHQTRHSPDTPTPPTLGWRPRIADQANITQAISKASKDQIGRTQPTHLDPCSARA